MDEFDVAISPSSKSGSFQCTIPAAIGRSLLAAGYNRAKVSVTKDGILLRPYIADTHEKFSRGLTVELPDWSKP